MKLFVMDFFSLDNLNLCRPYCVHNPDPCTCIAQVKRANHAINKFTCNKIKIVILSSINLFHKFLKFYAMLNFHIEVMTLFHITFICIIYVIVLPNQYLSI